MQLHHFRSRDYHNKKHCFGPLGINGNEKADELAKTTTELSPESMNHLSTL